MLSTNRIIEIQEQVKQAAESHLNARDPDTALSHFTYDALAVSNTTLFSTRESLAADIVEYYKILKKVNYAAWEDVHIQVIDEQAATFTARFRYGFTDVNDQLSELKGVWTALFVLEEGCWKIRLRHESFEPL